MIKKILTLSVFANLVLFAIGSRFVIIVGLLVMSLLGYEQYLRSRQMKFRRTYIPGRYATRLPFLPYSELEYNKEHNRVFGTRKKRAEVFAKKVNISSPLINYIQGLRKTSFVLDSQLSGSKIYLFGGSTIDCQEVPDDHTVPSLLQKSINTSQNNTFEVVVCGVGGAKLLANYALLKELPVKQGDICIFYFGANETDFPVAAYQTRFPASLIPQFNQLYTLSKKYNILSVFRILHKFQIVNENHPTFNEKNREIKEILDKICAQSKETGFKFAAILQPCLYTRVPMIKQDKKVLKKYFDSPRGKMIRYFNQTIVKINQNENYFIDGQKIFDSTNMDVYIDWVHTNYLGNQKISDFIHSVLRQNFFGDDSLIFQPPKRASYGSEDMPKSMPRAVSKQDENDDDNIYGVNPFNYPLF
jgi:hypothetical protein